MGVGVVVVFVVVIYSLQCASNSDSMSFGDVTGTCQRKQPELPKELPLGWNITPPPAEMCDNRPM